MFIPGGVIDSHFPPSFLPGFSTPLPAILGAEGLSCLHGSNAGHQGQVWAGSSGSLILLLSRWSVHKSRLQYPVSKTCHHSTVTPPLSPASLAGTFPSYNSVSPRGAQDHLKRNCLRCLLKCRIPGHIPDTLNLWGWTEPSACLKVVLFCTAQFEARALHHSCLYIPWTNGGGTISPVVNGLELRCY